MEVQFEPVCDLKAINVFATFKNDPWQIADFDSANDDCQFSKLETQEICEKKEIRFAVMIKPKT